MTDVIDDFLDGKPVGAPKRYKPNLTADDARALATTAQELGIDPVDLATVISYETGGTFNPDQRGPTTKWGQHRGLIQFGEPQRQKYGVRDGMSFAEQLPAVSAYLRDSGVKPGMGILDVYSAIDAGRPGRYNASDAAAGGAPGTVADKVNYQMGAHRKRAESWLGMIGIGSAGAAERGSAADIDAFLDAPVAAAPATPVITGEMRAYEPTFFDSISGAFDTLVGNHDGSFKRSPIARFTDAAGQVVDAITPDAFQRGIRRGEQGFLAATGGMMPATVLGPDADRAATAVQIGSLEREAGRYPQDPGRQAALGRISGAPDLQTAVGEAVRNPGAIADVILESLGVAAPQLAATAVSGVAGGPVGVGEALVTGAGSFGTEYGQTVLQAVQEAAGGDLQNVEAVSAALGNPELMAAARASAAKRGVPIAVFDALTAGLAGQIIKRARGIGQGVAAAGGEAALQAGGGMAGEATAQLSDKGQITSPGDVVLEGIAEVPTAAIEVPANLAHARANAEAAARVDTAPASEIAPETLRAGNEELREVGREELLAAAKARQKELQTKRDGTPDTETVNPETGERVKVRGTPPSIMTPKEKELLKFLEENEGNAGALAKGFGFKLSEAAGNESLAQAQAVDSFLDEPAAPAQQAEPAPTAEPQAQTQHQTAADGQQPAAGPDVAMQGEQPGQVDPAAAATTNAPAQPAESPAAAAPDPATATPHGQAAPAPAGAPVVQPPAGAGQPAMRFSSRSGSGTVSYNHLPDGRVRRTIVYDDGETFVEWLVTKKNGDEVWASTSAYEKNELYPVQVPENRLQTLIDDDLSSLGVVQRESAAAPQAASVSTPETPAAPRARFTSPDDVAAQEFIQRAVAEGVPEETARKLAAPAPRDEVTGYYDGRARGVKAGTVERAQEHVRSTGESAFYVDGDIVNLGGLNKAAKDDMTVANQHYRAMSDILRTELEAIGADVVPMRTGGDELGAVVVNAGEGAVRAAMQAADAKIREYAAQNGLDTIPHTKQGRTEVGVGLHLGLAPIVPGVPVSDIFSLASIDVNQSKEAGYVARTTTEGAGVGAPGGQAGAAARSAGGEGQGAGQQAAAPAERAQVKPAAGEVRAQDGVAPLLEQANDRPDVPARPEAAPQGGGNAAAREAAQLEDGGQGPEQSTRRGKGRDEFTQASFTNRRSWKQDAFRAAGLNPDEAELLPVGKQFEAVAGALKDKFGITAQMGNKAIGRMALDQVLDLYRNAQIMAHVLGLPEKAIGLGNSLTLLLRGDAPYLGAMYPGGGKVEGVDLPAGAIALPRRSNSFAHEWGHALDLFLTSKFGFPADGKLLTRKIRSDGIDFQPQSAQEAFVRLLDNLFYDQAELAAKVMALQQAADNGTPAQQAKAKAQLEKLARGNSRLKIDGSKYKVASREYGNEVAGKAGGEYFADPAELLARAFEAYIAARVEAAGGSTEVLAKGDSAYLSDSDERFAKTFPKLGERLQIFAAFDDLFAQLAKEQLIAQGVAASNPGNLDSFDPRKWLQDAPAKESGGIMGVIREQADEINAWRERNKREAARPQDPMTKVKRLQNSLMAWATPLQGVFRIMEKRYPQSKALRELANKLTTAPGKDRMVGRVLEQAIRITGGRNYNQFGNIIDRYRLDKLDATGRSELRSLLVSASDPASSSPELVKAATELRRLMDTLWYDNQEADINIGYTKNGYLPRVIDMAAVQADAAGFIEAATEAYKVQLQSDPDIDPASIDERAEAMARAWHANIVSAPPVNFSSAPPVENYTKHRSLPPEADTILEQFYVNDPLELIHQYIGRSARATEFAKAFGPKGEQLNALFRQMSAEGVLLEDQRYLQGSVSSLLGRQSAGWLDGKPRAQALMNQVNAYGVMSMLGRVLISSIAEPGMAGLRTGSAANVFRPYYNLFKQAIGSADSKTWREITRAIGLIGDAQADAVVQARLGGTFESTPKTDARLARYFAITGLHALTNAQRVSLMPVAHRYLAVMADDAVNGSPAAKRFAIAELRELGISDFQGFSEWIGDVDLPTIDMLFDANGRETEQGSAYMTAMSRVNEQIVQAPYRFDRPEAANSPGGRFLYGIMSFNMAFWNNVYKRQANVIAREYGKGGVSGAANVASYVAGNLAPPMIAYFMTQLLVTIAREALLNPQRWEEWDKDGTLNENLFMLTLSRAFPMGMFDPLIQAYQGLKYQRDLTGVAVGAVPSYFLGAAQKIVNAFTDANRPNTNNAEFSAMQGGYQLVANPLIAHVATSIPGGPILTPLAGAAVTLGTSAAARDSVATAVVGEKDSLVAKREAAAKREQKALQSGGGSVRNGDRQSSREKSDRGGTR